MKLRWLLLLALCLPLGAVADPTQTLPVSGGGGGGSALTAFSDTQDSAVFSNDGGTDDLTMTIPASASVLYIRTIEVTQIGGTYAGGFNSLNISTYLDAGKTENGTWFPFVNPLPVGADFQPGTEIMTDPPVYVLELTDNTFSGETAQYRVTITGDYLE